MNRDILSCAGDRCEEVFVGFGLDVDVSRVSMVWWFVSRRCCLDDAGGRGFNGYRQAFGCRMESVPACIRSRLSVNAWECPARHGIQYATPRAFVSRAVPDARLSARSWDGMNQSARIVVDCLAVHSLACSTRYMTRLRYIEIRVRGAWWLGEIETSQMLYPSRCELDTLSILEISSADCSRAQPGRFLIPARPYPSALVADVVNLVTPLWDGRLNGVNPWMPGCLANVHGVGTRHNEMFVRTPTVGLNLRRSLEDVRDANSGRAQGVAEGTGTFRPSVRG